MALPATLVWEVRPTNGTANAGGGFKAGGSGTDFSQQNAVQVAYTDLVIDAVTNTNVTSAAFPFGATHVDNLVAITGGTGFTVGIFHVVSVAGAVATLDRAVGTLSSTGGIGNLGGARSGTNVGTTTLAASLVAGNKVWIKNEAWNEAVNFTVAGTAGSPIVIEGYNVTRGDKPTGATRPTNDRAAAAGHAFTFSGNGYFLYYLIAKSAGANGFNLGNSTVGLISCRSTANGGNGVESSVGIGRLLACEIDANSTVGFYVSGSNGQTTLYGCYVHDNTSQGIRVDSPTTVIIECCIIEANALHGLSALGASTYVFHGASVTIDGNTGVATDGVSLLSPFGGAFFVNNCFTNNGRYGASATDGLANLFDYNNYFGNVTAARNNVPTGPNDRALDPQFTNRAGGDFSIGTNLKALGFPGLFPGGFSTGYLDIGAVQRQEPAGGGTTIVLPQFRKVR